MSERVAILVDDADFDRAKTAEALSSAGFTVEQFADAATALRAVKGEQRVIDLIVLDRQLPLSHGDAASNEIGDQLLQAVLVECPDQKVIVLSGHSDYDHLQFAQSDRGTISLRSGAETFDRVSVLRKGQSLEFDSKVTELSVCLRAIDDINIDGNPELGFLPEALIRRILRRVAYEFEAVSISCRTLAGGASGDPVWLCEMSGIDSVVAARAVVKVQKSRSKMGGFQSILPAPLLAGVTNTVEGFCGGRLGSVQQVAGSDPVALMSQLRENPSDSVAAVRLLIDALDSLPAALEMNLPLEEVLLPFGEWEELSEWAGRHEIPMPSRSKICAATRRLQHGDLHPGNVLLVDCRPVLIDFDRQSLSTSLLDPVVLTLSPLFHPASDVRWLDWPDDRFDHLGTPAFFDAAPYAGFARAAWGWLESRARSALELCAAVLGYSLRQLKYEDVRDRDDLRLRAVELARWAANILLRD